MRVYLALSIKWLSVVEGLFGCTYEGLFGYANFSGVYLAIGSIWKKLIDSPIQCLYKSQSDLVVVLLYVQN